MGRFAEESHADLREWYVHCIDFLALKRRLIDDPPDPYDDHPSMSEPSPLSASTAGGNAMGNGGSGGAVDGEGLLEREGLLSAEPGAGGPVAAAAAGGDGGVGAGDDAEGGICVVFPDPPSRVFAFEIKQEIDRMWGFYRGESEQCAAKLSSLHDSSASSRHQLHRKLGGAGSVAASPPPPPQLADADTRGNGGRSGVPSVATGGCLRPTPQELHLYGNGSGRVNESQPRIRGRKSVANPTSSEQEPKAALSPASVTTGAGDRGGSKTTEDPYIQAALKRAIVELYNNCHRLLSFKMLNYDACVRLVELHCRRAEAEAGAGSSPWASVTVVGVDGVAGVGGDPLGSGSATAAATSFLAREKSMKMWLLEQRLFASRELNRTLAGAELLYASLFCNGDVDVARTALTFKASSSLRGNRRFDFGYRLGLATVLLVWALWDCVADDSLGKDVWHDPAFDVFRGLGNLVLLVYMWGINIWVWRRFGIDYERCLSLDPKGPRVDPCEQVWNTGCNLSIWFLVCFICFYKALRGVLGDDLVPTQFAHTFPFLLLLRVIYGFLTPWSERKALLYVLWTVIISPLGQVRFLEGYVGDILTSVVRVLIDIAFALFYYFCGIRGAWLGVPVDFTEDTIKGQWYFKTLVVPLLTVAPLWWRFQQNMRRSYETRNRWPHLGNALKYATAMSVSLFGTFQPQNHGSWIWVFCFVFATLYQFTWDIIMDWDLLRWDGRSVRLRPRLLYRSKSMYVGVAILNLALRFLWTVTLLPENTENLFPKDFNIYLSPFVAAAEIFRRTMWGFLRVENEHLHIYDGIDTPGAETDGQRGGFQQVSSASAPSCGSGAAVPVVVVPKTGGASEATFYPGGSSGGGGNGTRGGGLDRLPYARMEISSAGIVPRSKNAVKAWCFTRVTPEARPRLLAELCAFSLALVSLGFLAGLS